MIRVLREQHEAPADVQRILRLAGGINRYGEANYRAVWGWSRLEWIGGKWEDRNDAGELVREVMELRRVPKYLPFNRWHIERWLPPEMYGSPREWYRTTMERDHGVSIPALGPYPERGEYEHVLTIQQPNGAFLQLTAEVARRVALIIEQGMVSFTPSERLAALRRRESKADKDYEQWAMDVLSDGKAFQGQTFVTVA